MKTTIRTWGNSLAVRIPKAYAMHLGIISGKEVELSMEQNALHITSIGQDLELLLEKITAENLHAETDTSDPQGRELW